MISRLNAVLVVLVIVCALAVVSVQNTSRHLVVELNSEQDRAHALEVEYGQLQLEQGTLAAHVRVAALARERLGMRPPAPGQVVVIDPRAETLP